MQSWRVVNANRVQSHTKPFTLTCSAGSSTEPFLRCCLWQLYDKLKSIETRKGRPAWHSGFAKVLNATMEAAFAEDTPARSRRRVA
jgi:hypothetical protein